MATFACQNPSVSDVKGKRTSSELYSKAYAYNEQQKFDSAYLYFYENTRSSEDSLEIAYSYDFMSNILFTINDYFGAIEAALNGLNYVNEKDSGHHPALLSIYNDLGRANEKLKDYKSAVEYFEKAIVYNNDSSYRSALLNNTGIAYRNKGDVSTGLKILEEALSISTDRKNYARTLSNWAITKWEKDNSFKALPYLHEALYIRDSIQYQTGITTSYQHLTEYYLTQQKDSAKIYALRMLESAGKTRDKVDEQDALLKLIYLSASNESEQYFERYQHLRDSLETNRMAARNQFAAIRFESEKSKAINLKLQNQLIKQKLIIYSAIVFLILLFVFAILWYKRKKQEIIWQNEEAIKDHQIKTSQKVHDVVANGLYRIMSEIEHNTNGNQEKLLDQIEELYERSRDISYEPVTFKTPSNQVIENLLTSFANDNVRVLAVGNKPEIWKSISNEKFDAIEKVLTELLINMAKHSKAKHVVFQFKLESNHLKIIYKDNGIGFAPNTQTGNGLTSTGIRISQIGGSISFTPNKPQGAEIIITIPIS